jgi:hypothetical protein
MEDGTSMVSRGMDSRRDAPSDFLSLRLAYMRHARTPEENGRAQPDQHETRELQIQID